MDKFPLLVDDEARGHLTMERERLYTWFEARCPLPGEGLWCAWAVGESGELRLGVLEPCGECGSIRRRFSQRMTEPLGKLLRGELRPSIPASGPEETWSPADCPPELAPWMADLQGAVWRRSGERLFLAAPYDPKAPFPLPKLFCFANVRPLNGHLYAVFAFDLEGNPVF